MGSSCWRFVTAVLCVASFSSVAQETVQPETEYANKVGKAQQMGRLNDGTFGEKIPLFNGQLSFRTTDVSIPGNVGPPVEPARKRSISERYLHQEVPGLRYAGAVQRDFREFSRISNN